MSAFLLAGSLALADLLGDWQPALDELWVFLRVNEEGGVFFCELFENDVITAKGQFAAGEMTWQPLRIWDFNTVESEDSEFSTATSLSRVEFVHNNWLYITPKNSKSGRPHGVFKKQEGLHVVCERLYYENFPEQKR